MGTYIMKNRHTKFFLSMAIAINTVSVAEAHTSFVTSNAVAGKSFFGTLNVGHGCEDSVTGVKYDTERLEVMIPEGVSSIRTMDAPWASASIEKNAEGAITKLIWTRLTVAHSEDDYLYQVSFKATLPNAPMTTLSFDAIQFCHNDSNAEITAEWSKANGKAPTLKLLSASTPGWNKFTAPVAIDEAMIKSFFSDALIVWSNSAAYSANPVTANLITNKLTTIPLGAEFWVKY